jgi:predicted TIM-barrel fold metal-dependent hydrolase
MTSVVTVDVHQHAASAAYLQAAGRPRGRYDRLLIDVDDRLRQMDEANVDIAVLSIPPPGPHSKDAQSALHLSRLANDHLIELADLHPDRFRVLATLPLPHRDQALLELERVAGHGGVRGLCLHTHSVDWKVDLFEESGVAESCATRGWPVLLHPAGDIRIDDPDPCNLSQVIGLPASSTAALLRMIGTGVLDRLPTLEVILPHGGGLLAVLQGRADDQLLGEHVNPLGHYISRMWFDTCLGDEDLLRFLMSQWGSERFLLGSDYPYRGRLVKHVQEWLAAKGDVQSAASAERGQSWFL